MLFVSPKTYTTKLLTVTGGRGAGATVAVPGGGAAVGEGTAAGAGEACGHSD